MFLTLPYTAGGTGPPWTRSTPPRAGPAGVAAAVAGRYTSMVIGVPSISR